jgi:hypothetical protein
MFVSATERENETPGFSELRRYWPRRPTKYFELADRARDFPATVLCARRVDLQVDLVAFPAPNQLPL